MATINKIQVNGVEYDLLAQERVYDNTEKVVGTYFDKPLYQKDWNGLTYSSNNETKDLGFDSTIEIIDYHQVYTGSGIKVSSNFANNTKMYFTSDNLLHCETANADAGWSKEFRLSVWYTKTTDVINS